MTLRDVADRAGVAPITVSRALNNPNSVSPTLRVGIMKAVDALGYVRNRFAGALASADSRVVPVIVSTLANEVFIEVIEGIQATLEHEGFELLLGNSQYDLVRERELVSTLLGWSPAGMIVAGCRHEERTRRMLRGFAGPVVEIMELARRPIDMNVGLSHVEAGRTMGLHLIERGYRDIGFVGCRINADHRAGQRFEGLDRALAEAGLRRRPPFTHPHRSSIAVGGRKLVEVLQADPALDAIFFANDDLAVGALLRAQHDGIDVAGRSAIGGFNGFSVGTLTTPALTTVMSPRYEIGVVAATKLLARIRGANPGPARVDLGFRLEIRGST